MKLRKFHCRLLKRTGFVLLFIFILTLYFIIKVENILPIHCFLVKTVQTSLFTEITAFFHKEKVEMLIPVNAAPLRRAAAGQTHRLHSEFLQPLQFPETPTRLCQPWDGALLKMIPIPLVSRKPFPSSESLRPLLFHVRLSPFSLSHTSSLSLHPSITTLLPSASTVLWHFCVK